MSKLTVKELLELKGVRQIAFVQVARSDEAIAASAADMVCLSDAVLHLHRG
jgi:3-methyl-2-oxobutanoate hydroxymethyltransferase